MDLDSGYDYDVVDSYDHVMVKNIHFNFYCRHFGNDENEPPEFDAYALIHRWA